MSAAPRLSRLLLVDGDRALREELGARLAAAPLEVSVTIAESAQAAIALARQQPSFEVALLDVELPDGSGLAVIEALHRSQPNCQVVVHSAREDVDSILGALRAGACGYLLKRTPYPALSQALVEARAGGAPMSPTVARVVVGSFVRREPATESLTNRERDVLVLLARGHIYADIASALDLSLGTVQGYVKTLYAKLEISSKAEAAAIASRIGLI
ncbi:MAG: response regulator transcription factor [Polyangiaceae bacterium]